MSTDGVRYHIKKIMMLSGIDKYKEITPHSFRRSFATHCSNKRISPFFIKDLMGHSDIKTT